MNPVNLFALIPLIIAAAALAVSLWTGKTLGPQGTTPLIVNRSEQPGRYAFGIGMLTVFVLVTGSMAWAVFFDQAPS